MLSVSFFEFVSFYVGFFVCVKFGVSEAMVVGSGDRSRLSWRQSLKVGARFLLTEEEVALAVEEMMEHSSGKLAACVKGALVLFLVAQVNQLVSTGIALCTILLTHLATRILHSK